MTTHEWLELELDRVWLRAELCVRALVAGGLRPRPTGDLAAILAARGARSVDALERAAAAADRDVLSARLASPLASRGLSRLEAETLVLAIAPHVEPMLVELFAVARGEHRPVDLALVIQLHQLAREDRVALLAVLDPRRPLLAQKLVDIAPLLPDAASATARAIQPTLQALAMIASTPAFAGPSHASPVLSYFAD